MNTRSIFASAAALMAASSAAFGHGDEGGSGGTILPAGTTRVTLGYDITSYKEISDATLKALALQGIGEVHSLKTISVPSVTIGYGITSDFTLALRLPYLHNQEIRETDPAAGDVAARGGVDGIGDLSISGTYRFVDDRAHGFQAAGIFGVKTPTGRTNAVDDLGEEFETEHQPGSGAWDGMVGAVISQELAAATLSLNGLYTFPGKGSRDTTLGDRFSYGATLSYRLWSGQDSGGPMHLGMRPDGIMHHGGAHHDDGEAGHTDVHTHDEAHGGMALDASLGLNGEWQDKHDVAGEREDNTGGHVLYVTPGVKLTVDKWAGFVSVAIPIARDLNGIQADPDWRLSTGISLDF